MGSMQRLYNVEQVRRAARRALPRVLFDYIDGDAEDGTTRRANRAGYERLALRQQVPTSVDKSDLGVEVLGRSLRLPIIVAPCGLAALVHPDGPIGAARAAAGRGTVSVLSTVAGTSPGDLAAAVDDPGWFQLYAPGGRDGAEPLIAEVQELGFEALVVTTDTAVLGRRGTGPVARHLDAAAPRRPHGRRPRRAGRRSPGLARATPQGSGRQAPRHRRPTRPPPTRRGRASPAWERRRSPGTISTWIRERWDGPLIVKGLVTADDARRARDAGAQAVVVSNHGGRQLDGAPATIDALPAVVDAVGSDLDVIVDGGVRRGTDVIKALSLGARAVQIGRPWLFGLAVGGQDGVEHVLRLYRNELRTALALMDVTSVADLGRGQPALSPVGPSGRPVQGRSRATAPWKARDRSTQVPSDRSVGAKGENTTDPPDSTVRDAMITPSARSGTTVAIPTAGSAASCRNRSSASPSQTIVSASSGQVSSRRTTGSSETWRSWPPQINVAGPGASRSRAAAVAEGLLASASSIQRTPAISAITSNRLGKFG